MPFVPDQQPVAPGRFVPDVRAPGAAAHQIPIRGTAERAPQVNRGRAALDALLGAGELVAGGAAEALATVPRGLTGLAAGTGALLTGQDPMAAGARAVEAFPRFEPSERVQRVVAPIAETVAPIARRADLALASLGPAGETLSKAGLRVATEAVPVAKVGRTAAPALEAAVAGRAARAAERALPTMPESVRAARRAGFKLRPTDVQAASPTTRVRGRGTEQFARGPELRRDILLENQQNTTRLAGEEFRLKGATQLDDAAFNKLKAPHFRTYQTVEKVAAREPATPEFQKAFDDAVERAKFKATERPGITKVIGALRRRSAKNIQAKDVATQEAGFTDRAVADRLEDLLGQRLAAAGDAKAIGAYRTARQSLAKVNDVETATRAGQVDAHLLLKLRQKGAPLSGNLAVIADAAENFPEVTKHSLRTAAITQPKEPVVIPVVGHIARGAERLVERGVSARVRSKGFQERFGRERPSELGDQLTEFIPAPAQVREQGGLDIPGPMIMEPAPGRVGRSVDQIIRELQERGIKARPKKRK